MQRHTRGCEFYTYQTPIKVLHYRNALNGWQLSNQHNLCFHTRETLPLQVEIKSAEEHTALEFKKFLSSKKYKHCLSIVGMKCLFLLYRLVAENIPEMGEQTLKSVELLWKKSQSKKK